MGSNGEQWRRKGLWRWAARGGNQRQWRFGWLVHENKSHRFRADSRAHDAV